MSDIRSYNIKGKRKNLILRCLRTAAGDSDVRNKIISAELLFDFFKQRYQVTEEMFNKRTMLIQINKVYAGKLSTIELDGGENVEMYRHKFRSDAKTMTYLFYFTKAGGIVPTFPVAKKSTEWADDHVLKRLLAGSHRNPVDLCFDLDEEDFRRAKKQRVDSAPLTTTAVSPIDTTEQQMQQADTTAAVVMPPPNYWESGEARRLFVPKELFGENSDVKQIVLDRIEHLERVNQEADAWRTVIEDADKDNTMTEHDIFILRLRSLYLAVAIKK